MKYLKLIRINNWVKNLFIFIPLFFSSDLLNVDKFTLTFFGSLGFSLVTSFVYIINDINDIIKYVIKIRYNKCQKLIH